MFPVPGPLTVSIKAREREREIEWVPGFWLLLGSLQRSNPESWHSAQHNNPGSTGNQRASHRLLGRGGETGGEVGEIFERWATTNETILGEKNWENEWGAKMQSTVGGMEREREREKEREREREKERERERERRKGRQGKRKDRYECQRDKQRAEHRAAEEEEDRVKVRSCEAENAAKSHTDCTYSKPGSESG